jgi:ubiquinone biosynthesis accessory factor UbiK
MMESKFLDNLAHRLSGAVPKGLQQAQADLERNFRANLQSALGRLDLVTREEFDVQVQVLARTRAVLDALEAQVRAMERARNEK